MTRGFVIFIAVIVLGCAYVVSAASGADAQIVALGASNTRGKWVASDETYSARLEVLLRSRGIAVTVTNEGVDFDTLSGMLRRLDRSVPQGTRIVILQVGGPASRLGRQGDWQSDVSTLRSRLEARRIQVIIIRALSEIVPPDAFQPDGRHLTAAGHAMVAEWLLPQVMEALKTRGNEKGTF